MIPSDLLYMVAASVHDENVYAKRPAALVENDLVLPWVGFLRWLLTRALRCALNGQEQARTEFHAKGSELFAKRGEASRSARHGRDLYPQRDASSTERLLRSLCADAGFTWFYTFPALLARLH